MRGAPRFAVIANSPTQVNQAIFFSLAIIIVGLCRCGEVACLRRTPIAKRRRWDVVPRLVSDCCYIHAQRQRPCDFAYVGLYGRHAAWEWGNSEDVHMSEQ